MYSLQARSVRISSKFSISDRQPTIPLSLHLGTASFISVLYIRPEIDSRSESPPSRQPHTLPSITVIFCTFSMYV